MRDNIVWMEITGFCLFLMFTVFQVQAQEYTISGISAWSKAKENGFKFSPTRNTFDSYTNGKLHKSGFLDGVDDKISAWVFGVYMPVGQIVGGNIIAPKVPFSRTTQFNMFYGKKLKPGWKVKKVILQGSYIWYKKPKYGTNDLNYILKVNVPANKSKNVTIKSIVLNGPPGKRATDAFDI